MISQILKKFSKKEVRKTKLKLNGVPHYVNVSEEDAERLMAIDPPKEYLRHGKVTMAGNLRYLLDKYEGTVSAGSVKNRRNTWKMSPVLVTDLVTGKKTVYENITEAARKTGKGYSGVYRACQKGASISDRKTPGNYSFRLIK